MRRDPAHSPAIDASLPFIAAVPFTTATSISLNATTLAAVQGAVAAPEAIVSNGSREVVVSIQTDGHFGSDECYVAEKASLLDPDQQSSRSAPPGTLALAAVVRAIVSDKDAAVQSRNLSWVKERLIVTCQKIPFIHRRG
jgi:hypothetical protein